MLQPGDIVKIKPYNKINNRHSLAFVDGMIKYCEKVTTVMKETQWRGEKYYNLDGCTINEHYYEFSEDWLEVIEQAGPVIEINDDEIFEMFK